MWMVVVLSGFTPSWAAPVGYKQRRYDCHVTDSGWAHVTETGNGRYHGFRKMGDGKSGRDSGLRGLVPPPSPTCRKERSGMGGFVGIEVAAEGGVFDLEIVVALLQFLDGRNHRGDEGRVFEREGFVRAAVGHQFRKNRIDLLRDEAHVRRARGSLAGF